MRLESSGPSHPWRFGWDFGFSPACHGFSTLLANDWTGHRFMECRWSEMLKNARKTMTRREALGAMGAAGAALALGCAGDTVTGPTTTGTTPRRPPGQCRCAVTPTETIGPYPSLVDLIRSDVREDRTGTQLNLTIKVVNANSACAPVANADVEIWHCDVAGNYSQYGASTGRTFLRGIQRSDANGDVTFTTIYPGWYQGRATHIHLEVVDQRGLAQGDADRVPGEREQHRPHSRRLRLSRDQPDDQRWPTASSPTACRPSSSRPRAASRPATRRRFKSGSRSSANSEHCKSAFSDSAFGTTKRSAVRAWPRSRMWTAVFAAAPFISL